jgi:acyl-coenzyme A thioesterase PaaI-like protein
MDDTDNSDHGAPLGPDTVYFPGPAADPVSLSAKQRLAETLRELIDQVVTLDASAAGVAAIEEVAREVAGARAAIEHLPKLEHGERWQQSRESSLHERGPFTGLSNPIASPLHLDRVGDTTTGWAVYGHAYEGDIGTMHGGAVAAAFDDLLGCTQLVAPVAGRTGTLTVRYRAVSPIGRRIDYTGHVDHVDGRKVFCRGTARCGDTLVAEAEAIFVAPPASVQSRSSRK